MKVNIEEFRRQFEFINEQKHPTLDLIIWNYSQRCQFAKEWNAYTEMCRGLITDSEGNIVARPFRKFFNWGERDVNIPEEMPEVTEKVDGSMGILYFDGERPYIATRGSFKSEQALHATELIQKSGLTKKDFIDGKTYIFEIIY